MLASRTLRLGLLTVLGAVLAAALMASAAAAAQRYASPTGSGSVCSSASPCAVMQAINFAAPGDEVIVKPGFYWLSAPAGAPLLHVEDTAQITIHGSPGQPRPRLVFDGANQFGLVLSHGSTLRDVAIEQTEPVKRALTSYWAAELDRVTVLGSGGGDCAAWIRDTTMRNSIVVGEGTAICAQANATYPANASTYRNVTAIATAAAGVAIDVWAHDAPANATVNLVNVIAQAGKVGAGLEVRTDSSGAHATITAAHTNFANYLMSGTNAQYVDGGGNQGTPPAFVNLGAGPDRYRQAPGSPTIDAGLNDAANGASDVDGDPRQIATTDIGADEVVPAPASLTGRATVITDRAATLSGSVNANGAPAEYHFEYGPTTAYGNATPTADAGSGTSAVAAAATLGGLGPQTTYHYRLVATNATGMTNGADRTLTTASPTPTSTSTSSTATTSASTASTPTFAGVRLASTRLAFARGFITVTLRCPSATVGRCSGKTTLTARRRATSPHRVTSVTLGRAAFSIAAGKQARVTVRVSRAGRWLLSRVHRLPGKDSNAARNAAGQSKTTVAAVTIRARHR